MVDNRVTFGSKLGVILATVGCAVGLGSIWRFPYMLGTNGGAAFLLIYILFMIFLGIPVMVTEFFIGRYSRSNTVGSFKKMAPGTKWCWIGYNGILAAFLILGFYAVVSGWTLEYVWQTVNGNLYSTPGVDFTAGFDNFSSNALRPIFWTAVFIGLTHFVIASGVEKGIERASKIMMPLLFFILVVMCVRSVTLPNAEAGLVYLFKPDFSKLTSSVVLSAVGQAFFSLSLGMGCLITYSSYFGKDTNMLATAWQVTIINTFVAVLAGIMIFPAVFSFGIAPSAGAQLVFITLPNVFEQLPFSSLWSLIFYILLAMAALTSTISLHEVVTAYIHEEFRMTRKRAACFDRCIHLRHSQFTLVRIIKRVHDRWTDLFRCTGLPDGQDHAAVRRNADLHLRRNTCRQENPESRADQRRDDQVPSLLHLCLLHEIRFPDRHRHRIPKRTRPA